MGFLFSLEESCAVFSMIVRSLPVMGTKAKQVHIATIASGSILFDPLQPVFEKSFR